MICISYPKGYDILEYIHPIYPISLTKHNLGVWNYLFLIVG